ncbi:MAG: hypothetical protein ACYCTB_09875 [bacterium]
MANIKVKKENKLIEDTHFLIEYETKQKLKMIALKKNTTISKIIQDFVHEYIEKNKELL